MKGLLYREFYITKKNCLLMFGLITLFAVFSILVMLSIDYGNLQYTDLESSYMQNLFIYTICSISVIFVENAIQAIYSDYSIKWMKFSYCMPVSPIRAVGIHYLYGFVLIGIGMLFNLLYIGALCLITGKSLQADVLKNVGIILLLGVVWMVTNIPMALKYKTAQEVGKRTTIVLVTAYLVIAAAVTYGMHKMRDMNQAETEQYAERLQNKFEEIRDVILLLLPLIIIILVGFSLWVSVKIYQRREK